MTSNTAALVSDCLVFDFLPLTPTSRCDTVVLVEEASLDILLLRASLLLVTKNTGLDLGELLEIITSHNLGEL
jgi:hypothetical protein